MSDHRSGGPVGARVEHLAAGANQSQLDGIEQRYRWLVDHSPVAMCVHVDGCYVYVNDTMVRKMGAQSADQLLGRQLTDFVHADSIPTVSANIAARRHEGDATPPSEILISRLDGTTRVVEAVAVRTQWEGKPAHQVIFRELTPQREADANVRLQAALVNHVSDAIIATTPAGTVTSWNPAAAGIYGRSAAEALGLPVVEAIGAALDLPAVIAGGGVVHGTHHAADGSSLSMRVSVSRMDTGYVVVCADQTALRRAEQYFQTVVASLEEGVAVIAADGAVEVVNPAALRILGFSTEGVDVKEFSKAAKIPIYDGNGGLLSADQKPVLKTLKDSPKHGCIYGIDRLDTGRRIWLSVNWSPLDPTDPIRSSILVSFTDITDHHNAHQRLVYQASHDLVTGLPNRAHILAIINDAISSGAYRWGAVLYIDMDKFKRINDALGHHAGDTVLQIAAQRLRRALRADDVVGRVGGDEFVALLAAPTPRSAVDELAGRLHAALGEPIVIASEGVSEHTYISASIGIVPVQPGEQRDAAQILNDADFAMYHAKESGQSTSHFRERAAGHRRHAESG